jgi:hypothetical protein
MEEAKLKGLAPNSIDFDPDLEISDIDERMVKEVLETRPRLSQKKGTVIIFGTGGEISGKNSFNELWTLGADSY